MTNQPAAGVFLALDVGASRIGVAQARSDVRLSSPLTWLSVDDTIFQQIQDLVIKTEATAVVVGLPRGLNGQETDQTKSVREFVATLKTRLTVPLYWQDEALTSKQAEDNLAVRGKAYDKGDIDAEAAAIILHDFLDDPQKVLA